jgi:hypothetical protein
MIALCAKPQALIIGTVRSRVLSGAFLVIMHRNISPLAESLTEIQTNKQTDIFSKVTTG